MVPLKKFKASSHLFALDTLPEGVLFETMLRTPSSSGSTIVSPLLSLTHNCYRIREFKSPKVDLFTTPPVMCSCGSCEDATTDPMGLTIAIERVRETYCNLTLTRHSFPNTSGTMLHNLPAPYLVNRIFKAVMLASSSLWLPLSTHSTAPYTKWVSTAVERLSVAATGGQSLLNWANTDQQLVKRCLGRGVRVPTSIEDDASWVILSPSSVTGNVDVKTQAADCTPQFWGAMDSNAAALAALLLCEPTVVAVPHETTGFAYDYQYSYEANAPKVAACLVANEELDLFKGALVLPGELFPTPDVASRIWPLVYKLPSAQACATVLAFSASLL